MKRITHTKDSLKMYEFLQKYPNQWHSIAKDKKTSKAFERVQELHPNEVEFDGFTNQFRYNSI